MKPWQQLAGIAVMFGCALTSSAPGEALTLQPSLVNEDPSGLSTSFKNDFPWLTVTFTTVDSDTVHVKIQSDLLVGPFTTQVNWNTGVGTAFTFTGVTNTGSFVVASGPSYSSNGFLADGATNGAGTGFDFQATFATTNSGGGSQRFNLVDALDFDINCTANCTGFNDTSFDAFNPAAAKAYFQLDGTQIPATQPCAGGPGLCYRIAAHIQGLSGGSLSSIWIAGVRPEEPQQTVPEPSAFLMLGAAVAGLGAFTRKKVLL
jgi:hypothetical protein